MFLFFLLVIAFIIYIALLNSRSKLEMDNNEILEFIEKLPEMPKDVLYNMEEALMYRDISNIYFSTKSICYKDIITSEDFHAFMDAFIDVVYFADKKNNVVVVNLFAYYLVKYYAELLFKYGNTKEKAIFNNMFKLVKHNYAAGAYQSFLLPYLENLPVLSTEKIDNIKIFKMNLPNMTFYQKEQVEIFMHDVAQEEGLDLFDIAYDDDFSKFMEIYDKCLTINNCPTYLLAYYLVKYFTDIILDDGNEKEQMMLYEQFLFIKELLNDEAREKDYQFTKSLGFNEVEISKTIFSKYEVLLIANGIIRKLYKLVNNKEYNEEISFFFVAVVCSTDYLNLGCVQIGYYDSYSKFIEKSNDLHDRDNFYLQLYDTIYKEIQSNYDEAKFNLISDNIVDFLFFKKCKMNQDDLKKELDKPLNSYFDLFIYELQLIYKKMYYFLNFEKNITHQFISDKLMVLSIFESKGNMKGIEEIFKENYNLRKFNKEMFEDYYNDNKYY